MNSKNTNELSTEQNKQTTPKNNKKKILGNVFLFSSFVVGGALLIGLPLGLNKKINQKRQKFFDDKDLGITTKVEETEIAKDKEYEFSFTQENKNIKDKILNKDARVLNSSLNWKDIKPPLFRIQSDLGFSNKESDYSNFFKSKYADKKDYYKKISSSEEDIYKFDYLNFLKEYYENKFKDEKNPLNLKKLVNNNLNDNSIKALQRVFINFTYVFEKDKKYYYQDIKNEFLGINIREFIKKINDELTNFRNKYPGKKITYQILAATFVLKAKLNKEKTNLNEIYMDSIFKIKAKIE